MTQEERELAESMFRRPALMKIFAILFMSCTLRDEAIGITQEHKENETKARGWYNEIRRELKDELGKLPFSYRTLVERSLSAIYENLTS